MRIILTLLVLAWSVPSLADEVVIYRCSDEDGALTLQDFPCASGQSQREQRFERPLDPAPAAPAASAAFPAPVQRPSAMVAEAAPEPMQPARGEVPALFQCRTFDEQSYFSERGDGNRRCVPLEITRIGSAPLPGAANACEWVVDECTRLDAEAACEGWQRLYREAARAEREAFSDTLARAREELGRLAAIRDSACGR